jgi:hypothetical protein
MSLMVHTKQNFEIRILVLSSISNSDHLFCSGLLTSLQVKCLDYGFHNIRCYNSCPLQVAEMGINPRCLQPCLQLSMEAIDRGTSNSASSCRWRGSTWAPPTTLPVADGGAWLECLCSFLCHLLMVKMDLRILWCIHFTRKLWQW